ncbi:MAG: PEP-CTERM sorting domain-containing protein [Burkholderiaceae bacterium]
MKMKMKIHRAVILVASAVLGVAFAPAHADTVAPSSLASSPGNAAGPAPIRYFGTGGSRVQEVFSSSFFSTGSQLLSAIQFRPTPGATPNAFSGATVNVSDIQVRLTTTSFLDESGTPLSSTFATNLGLGAQTVYSGALSLQTAATGSPVRDFDYTITLQTPFLYNPAAGNLLLDVLIPTTATVSGTGFGFIAFDNVNTINDGIYSVLDINNGAALVGTADTSGAIARFVGVSAVPEPETYAMMIAGLGVMGFFARRRKQKTV